MPNEMPKNPANASIAEATKAQAGRALIVQTHALAVERQPLVNLGDSLKTQPRLVKVQDSINSVLRDAKTHAQLYLNQVQPAMIDTIARVDRYFNLQLALTQIIKTQDREKIVRSLQAAEDQANGFKLEADDVARRLAALRQTLSANGAEFMRQKQTLVEICSADDGVIKELDRQITDIDGKMGGMTAGAVISGLAIVGGALLIAIGSIAGFVTAGTSVPLAVLGGVILVGGISGAVGTGVGLGALAKQKSDLILQKTSLNEEVRFAQALQSTLGALHDSAAAAASAAQDMSNAWTLLGGHLKNLADDLQAGRLEIDTLLELFVAAAEGDVKDIKGDVRLIQQQIAGVQTIAPESSPESLSLADAITIANHRAGNDNAAHAA